jgi:glutaconate CoA-transferase subunit B
MNHEKRRFLQRVSYITSPGFGEGGDWREREGLRGRGPSAVITTKAILRFDPETREMVLVSVHPGVSVEEVLEGTGWVLKVAASVEKTKPPLRSELRIIRKYDAQGFWTRRKAVPES